MNQLPEYLLSYCCVALLYALFAMQQTHPRSFTVQSFFKLAPPRRECTLKHYSRYIKEMMPYVGTANSRVFIPSPEGQQRVTIKNFSKGAGSQFQTQHH